MSTTGQERLKFYDYQPKIDSFYDEVIQGLKKESRYIPPKFFYDQTGSHLFDEICNQPEYYPTRTEIKILQDNMDDISACIGSDCVLLEPGCGSSQKVRLLLEAIRPDIYVPMDISGDYLLAVVEKLVDDFPRLKVHAACIDYTTPLALPVLEMVARKVAFFPGSTIGNFEPEAAIVFLRNLATIVGEN